MIEVSVSIPASLRTALDPAQYARALDATVNAAAESLRNRIAVYPGKSHSPVIWASEKSHRYYFAMRRQSGLPPNYTRNSDPMSQRLGPGWAVRKQGQADLHRRQQGDLCRAGAKRRAAIAAAQGDGLENR